MALGQYQFEEKKAQGADISVNRYGGGWLSHGNKPLGEISRADIRELAGRSRKVYTPEQIIGKLY